MMEIFQVPYSNYQALKYALIWSPIYTVVDTFELLLTDHLDFYIPRFDWYSKIAIYNAHAKRVNIVLNSKIVMTAAGNCVR